MSTDLANWTPRPAPNAPVLDGKYTRLEKLSPERHIAGGLREAVLCPDNATRYLYLMQYAPSNEEELFADMKKKAEATDTYFYATIIKETGLAAGYISIMRMAPEHGVFEIGNVYMGPDIARSRVSTEAVYLLLKYGFDELGNRRIEWKCNSLNAKSRAAALRFGFSYEGTFRNHLVVKGQNRDTTWLAMTDEDWRGGVKDSFEKWLDESNFTAEGNQIASLVSLRRA